MRDDQHATANGIPIRKWRVTARRVANILTEIWHGCRVFIKMGRPQARLVAFFHF